MDDAESSTSSKSSGGLSYRHNSASLSNVNLVIDTSGSNDIFLSFPSSTSFSDLSTSNSCKFSPSIASTVLAHYKGRFAQAVALVEKGHVSVADVFGAFLNFSNSILGAGLMGIPYAIRLAGLVPGIILLVLVAALSDWSVGLMTKSGQRVGALSYQSLMRKTFGKFGANLCGIFQVTFALGCLCIYQLIISENLQRVIGVYLPGSILLERSMLILGGSALILLPLSMARDIDFLGRAAIVSVGGNILIMLAIIIEGFRNRGLALASFEGYQLFSWKISESIGVIAFSFVCHHNSFLIQSSLGPRSSEIFPAVTNTSIGFSLVISLLLSVPSYIYFGQRTDPNILNNFAEDNRLINACRFLFALSLYFTYPLDCFVARDVMIRNCFPRSVYKHAKLTHILVTLSIVCFTTAITLLTTDLGVALELTGGVSASALAFIFPAACYLKIEKWRKEKASRAMKLGAVGLLAFGCLVICITAITPIIRLFRR